MAGTPLSSILLILFVTLLNYSWAETHLETKLTHIKNNLRSILAKYDQLKKENGVLKAEAELNEKLLLALTPMNVTSVGTTYVRWGRTECPETAELVYHGYTGKAYFSHGGGVNYQCLHNEPEWPSNAMEENQHHSYMYGVEYHDIAGWAEDTLDQDAPCVVCDVESRTRQVMIPGRETCPDEGWVREYYGFLVAQQYDELGSTFACLDKDFEFTPGGYDNDGGGTFYMVEARCGSLPCAPYDEGMELACVVCTK